MIIKKTLLPLIAVFSICGILLATAIDKTLPLILIIVSIFFIISIIIRKDKEEYKKLIFISLLLIIFCLFFFIYANIKFKRLDNDKMQYDGYEITVNGYVRDIKSVDDVSSSFELKSDTGRIIVINTDFPMDDLIIGNIYTVTGKFRKPDKKTNKGEFNYQYYCYANNITGTLYVYDTVDLLSNDDSPFITAIGKIKDSLNKRCMDIAGNELGSILTAILTGSCEYLSDETLEKFRDCGLSHIMSVSGMHFGIIIAIFTIVFNKLITNRKIINITMIIIMMIYLIFTGVRPSSVRAVICISISLICNMMFYDQNKIITISLASLVLLIVNPLVVYDTGFILSFSCVLSISIFYKPFASNAKIVYKRFTDRTLKSLSEKSIYLDQFIRRVISKRRNRKKYLLIDAFSFLVSVQPGSIIASLKLFYIFYPYSFIANIVVYFLLTPLMILGYLTLLIPAIFKYPCILLLKSLLKIVDHISGFNNARIYISDISFISLFCLISAILIILYSKRITETIPIRKMHIAAVCMSVLVIGIVLNIDLKDRVVFFDVGQGDSTLISTVDNVDILIDTGKYIPMSAIAYYSGQTLDAVFISHADSDHCNCIIEILDEFTVSNLFIPDTDDDKTLELIATIRNTYKDQNIILLDSSDTVVYKSVYIEAINPKIGVTYSNLNDSSLVLNIMIEGSSLLMTGDADLTDIELTGDLKTDILKVPHHGDGKCLNAEVLEYIDPSYAVISVGEDNSYGHPDECILDMFCNNNLNYVRTDNDGSIEIILSGMKYVVHKYR
ncbi:MAG: ComEC/Rec2 family competence protein [Clostridia bacterium]